MHAAVAFWQSEFYQIIVTIDDQEKCRILTAFSYTGCLSSTVQKHAETCHSAVVPLFDSHLATVGIYPSDIFNTDLFDILAGQEAVPTENRVFVTKVRQLF